ncbi:hypothetical protein DY000_02054799 [Brassica cretica]|uniref:Uncharacterized protein n=1 Tax=Brassica cretica TaxID=69181 RepID=A0ABQ7ALB6_BRACR|nr:hypothetical protein DY000_02054799 [Brassica cretica]
MILTSMMFQFKGTWILSEFLDKEDLSNEEICHMRVVCARVTVNHPGCYKGWLAVDKFKGTWILSEFLDKEDLSNEEICHMRVVCARVTVNHPGCYKGWLAVDKVNYLS